MDTLEVATFGFLSALVDVVECCSLHLLDVANHDLEQSSLLMLDVEWDKIATALLLTSGASSTGPICRLMEVGLL